MKKVFLFICALVISSFFSADALAKQTVSDTDAQIVQTFCQSSNLYAYVNIPKDKENNALIVSALLDNTYTFNQSEPITKVDNTKNPISYLFLIDISTSMPSYKENVSAFVDDLMTSAGNNASFAVATFGKDFKLKNDFTQNQEDIKTKLKEIEYNVKQTSLYSSIINVLDYYDKKERSEGEIFNIVLITDGIEYDKDGVTVEEVNERLKASPVIIHTFGLPTQSSKEEDKKASEDSMKVLGSFARATCGVHAVLSYEGKKEADLAGEITGFVNSLYLTKYNVSNTKLSGGSHSLKIVFAATGENGTLFDAEGALNIPEPCATLKPAASIAPAKEGTADNQDALVVAVDNGKALDHKNIFTVKWLGVPAWLWIVSAVLIIILVIILVLLLKKRNKPSASTGTGIFMKAEILSNNCSLKNNEFYLSDELIIGREKDCDIILKNKDVSKRNSRIYVRDNVIYMEDLNSTNGTAINNMKIFAPNKLRSGDVISIGSVRFLLKF
ncbi:MAG TPA: FHA domain-containing protein [Mobilitalea sp.]|nr:FHA domain-containing protein [Mobilitalea sp.]